MNEISRVTPASAQKTLPDAQTVTEVTHWTDRREGDDTQCQNE